MKIDIQSELHQTKRRFTDFVFQRVPVSKGGSGSHDAGDDSGSRPASPSSSSVQTAGGAAGAPQRILRTPRSVSSLNISKGDARHATTPASTGTAGIGTGGSAGASGVPLVRATSPGAEIREGKRLAAAKKEKEAKLRRALHSHSPAPSESPIPGSRSGKDSGRNSANGSGRASPASITSSSGKGPAHSLRRFQISKTGHPVNLHRSVDGGIQKRRGGGGGSDGVAVLVEKLQRKPHSRQAPIVNQLAVQAERNESAVPSTDGDGDGSGSEPRPRKRPVVNQAEKKWREERKNAISAAKQHISQVMDRGEDESDRLARDFEQIALELDGNQHIDVDVVKPASTAPTPARDFSKLPKPPLKYQPRTPNKPRPANPPSTTRPAPEQEAKDEDENDDSDSDYVYDVYIRKPLPQPEPTLLFSNPLTDLANTDQDAWFRQVGIDTTRQDIGVIVITQEDERYWENFVEKDDEERWDDEDADSNGTPFLFTPEYMVYYMSVKKLTITAENNPANDYPDEELSWDDEDDDPTAMYGKYRHATSDDEEFDFDDSASEGTGVDRRMGGFGYSHESDEEWY